MISTISLTPSSLVCSSFSSSGKCLRHSILIQFHRSSCKDSYFTNASTNVSISLESMTQWPLSWLFWPTSALKHYHLLSSLCALLLDSSRSMLSSTWDMTKTVLDTIPQKLLMEKATNSNKFNLILSKDPLLCTWTLPVLLLLQSWLKKNMKKSMKIGYTCCSCLDQSSSSGSPSKCSLELLELSLSAWSSNHTKSNTENSQCITTRLRLDTTKRTSRS